MEINLKPTPKQHEAYEALKDKGSRFVVFGGAAGGGKSWLACEWILTMCVAYPNTRWFIARNELTRLMASTYVTFGKVAKWHNVGGWALNGGYHYIEFKNGSRIDLIDVRKNPSDPMFERYGSTEYTGGVLEEAGEIDFGAFDVLKSRVGRHMNKDYNIDPKILITCNPKKNWLYNYVYKPFTEGKLEKEFRFIQSFYKDNPYTADTYEQQLKSIKDKTMKERLLYGNWEYENNPLALIEYDAITDMFTNTVDEFEDKFMSIDVARYGSDKTVLMVWQGFRCKKIESYTKTGLDVLAEEIKRIAKEERIPFSKIVIDEDGVGGGLVDMLRGCRGFMANRTPFNNKLTGKPDNFQNLKTQCTFLLADFINDHKIAIDCEDEDIKNNLISELEVIRQKEGVYDSKLQIESKDKIKEILGHSPDFSDALMMRMFFELQRPLKQIAAVDPINTMLGRSYLKAKNPNTGGADNNDDYL